MASTNLKNKHRSADEKLRILKLLTKNKKVRDICKKNKISRGSFYAWKNEYEADGFEGLKRKENNESNHPQRTSPEIVSRIIEFSIANPDLGCCSIASELKKGGCDISSHIVQKHLSRAQLGRISQRIYELEKRHLSAHIKINDYQKALINKNNPYFKYRGHIGSYPGEVLVQDTFQIFSFLPKTFIYVVIDTYSCYVFAKLSKTKSPEMAVELLSSTALKYFNENNFKVRKVITGKGKEFSSNKKEYTKRLHAMNITHDAFSEAGKRYHGYIEKFKRDLSLQLDCIQSEVNNTNTLGDFVTRICREINDNQNFIQWFPTFGNSPNSIVGKNVHL